MDTADIWFPTPPSTPNLSNRSSSRTASIHSVSSRPSSVASYASFHRNNNHSQEEAPFRRQQRNAVSRENKYKRTIICIQKYLTFQLSECVAVSQPGEKLFENFTSGSVDTCQAPGSGADLLPRQEVATKPGRR